MYIWPKFTLSLPLDTNLAAAEELLYRTLCETEGVMDAPPPAVYLTKIGADSLDFTIVCRMYYEDDVEVIDLINRRLLEALLAAGMR
jgi:small-conductance mechanosensitive channel